jgi:hypothetical protein
MAGALAGARVCGRRPGNLSPYFTRLEESARWVITGAWLGLFWPQNSPTWALVAGRGATKRGEKLVWLTDLASDSLTGR